VKEKLGVTTTAAKSKFRILCFLIELNCGIAYLGCCKQGSFFSKNQYNFTHKEVTHYGLFLKKTRINEK